MAVVPLRYANRFGFGMIEAQSVSEAGTVTTFQFNDHPQRRGNFFGGFWVKLPIVDATTGGTNTVEFATTGTFGSNVPLYLYSGVQATKADLATTSGGILLCFYDRVSNRLQAIGLSPATT